DLWVESGAAGGDGVGRYRGVVRGVAADGGDDGLGVVLAELGALHGDALVLGEEGGGGAGLVEADHPGDGAGGAGAVEDAEHRAEAVWGAVRAGPVHALQLADVHAAGADLGEQALLALVVLDRRVGQGVHNGLRSEVGGAGGGRVVPVARGRGPGLEV